MTAERAIGGVTAQPQARLESAMRARRLAAWIPPTRNLNTAIAADGDLTIRRAREIVLGNALATNAVDEFVANAIGTGIKPSPLLDDAEAKQAIQKLWLAWTDEADADGLTDFYGLQALVARELFVAGECFVRLRPRRASDGLRVPLQLQVLQAEMLPLSKTRAVRQSHPLRHRVRRDRRARRLLVPAPPPNGGHWRRRVRHRSGSLVQRGTKHAWSNRSETPCLMAFILVSASPV